VGRSSRESGLGQGLDGRQCKDGRQEVKNPGEICGAGAYLASSAPSEGMKSMHSLQTIALFDRHMRFTSMDGLAQNEHTYGIESFD